MIKRNISVPRVPGLAIEVHNDHSLPSRRRSPGKSSAPNSWSGGINRTDQTAIPVAFRSPPSSPSNLRSAFVFPLSNKELEHMGISPQLNGICRVIEERRTRETHRNRWCVASSMHRGWSSRDRGSSRHPSSMNSLRSFHPHVTRGCRLARKQRVPKYSYG